MPTYEYECTACDHKFEQLQGITENPLTKCPKCGKKKLVRLISSGSGLIFKGNGFYATDYKRSSAASKSEKSCNKDSSGGCSNCPHAH